MELFALAAQNLGTPMVLCFVLGLAAALAGSDLNIPEAVAKAMALYLLFAIGFKGGVSVNESGLSLDLIGALLAGIVLSATLPVIAFSALRVISSLSRIDAAAVAAHYGSISIVTFVAGTAIVTSAGLEYEGYLVAVAAAMEAPAILSALWLAWRDPSVERENDGELLREILLNGSIVLLAGAFVIGWITGPQGRESITSFIDAPFLGVLCLFLLDMGIVAGRGLRSSARNLSPPVIAFGLVMPLVSASLALVAALILGLSTGGTVLILTLAASASYIAVPAALRVALPEADPSIYLTLSLGITFPFNLIVGLPIYLAAARMAAG